MFKKKRTIKHKVIFWFIFGAAFYEMTLKGRRLKKWKIKADSEKCLYFGIFFIIDTSKIKH